LRRVEARADGHLANIAKKEASRPSRKRSASSRAAGGSVRDSLSLFDQAIGACRRLVRADAVAADALASRTAPAVIDLFDSLGSGDIARLLRNSARSMTSAPIVVLSDLAEFVNSSPA